MSNKMGNDLDLREETRGILKVLKSDHKFSQNDIEDILGYEKNYITQALSRKSFSSKRLAYAIRNFYMFVVSGNDVNMFKKKGDKRIAEFNPDISYESFGSIGYDNHPKTGNLDNLRVNAQELANEAYISGIQGNIKLDYVIGLLAELQEAMMPAKKAVNVALRVKQLVESDYHKVVSHISS